MRRLGIALGAAALALASAGVAWAQEGEALPVPGVAAARDVAGARELPDPKTEYKVLFDAVRAPEKPGDVNPMLTTAARYLNTLAKAGVPAANRKIVVLFHQGATPAIFTNDEFKRRNNGQDNPNVALMQALARAGVELHVCGQAVLGSKVDRKDIQPEVQVDLWALSTIVNLQLRGWVLIGG